MEKELSVIYEQQNTISTNNVNNEKIFNNAGKIDFIANNLKQSYFNSYMNYISLTDDSSIFDNKELLYKRVSEFISHKYSFLKDFENKNQNNLKHFESDVNSFHIFLEQIRLEFEFKNYKDKEKYHKDDDNDIFSFLDHVPPDIINNYNQIMQSNSNKSNVNNIKKEELYICNNENNQNELCYQDSILNNTNIQYDKKQYLLDSKIESDEFDKSSIINTTMKQNNNNSNN